MLGKMDCSGATHIGLTRQSNEDNFLIADICKSIRILSTSQGMDHETRLFGHSQGVVMLVADGMGGHEAGERASQLVVDSVVNFVLNELHWSVFDDHSHPHVESILKRSVYAAHQKLADDAASTPQRAGMGTTLTMMLVHWPVAYVVHIGDSRCYLQRQGEFRLLTRDHTVDQLRSDLASGNATAEQMQRFSDVQWSTIHTGEALWNVIATNAEDIQPEVQRLELKLGDSILLCSDGLIRHVEDAEISEFLVQPTSAEATCQKLIELANERGGSDNTTVVVAKFLDSSSALSGTAETGISLPATLDEDTNEFASPYK